MPTNGCTTILQKMGPDAFARYHPRVDTSCSLCDRGYDRQWTARTNYLFHSAKGCLQPLCHFWRSIMAKILLTYCLESTLFGCKWLEARSYVYAQSSNQTCCPSISTIILRPSKKANPSTIKCPSSFRPHGRSLPNGVVMGRCALFEDRDI